MRACPAGCMCCCDMMVISCVRCCVDDRGAVCLCSPAVVVSPWSYMYAPVGVADAVDNSLNYAAILETAADVAKAMLHLHRHQVRPATISRHCVSTVQQL